PLLPKYEPAIIGTMPSLYQQLPRSRHRAILDENRNEVDIMDADLWVENGWGLADPNQAEVLEWLLPDISDPDERREIAIDHLRKSLKRGKQFQEAIDQPAKSPENLKLHLLAGDAIPTGSAVTVDSSEKHYEITDYQPGDGTVTRSSALMDERVGGTWTPYLQSPIKWSNVMFLFSDHLGLTKDPGFSDNVLYILLEQPVQ
ncbi:MAG: hypothetical protein KAJ31_07250, partial [Deltaproteobacteria bacterium]|nr:hypothetical protein [Deltaproteobacteria bacterium]